MHKWSTGQFQPYNKTKRAATTSLGQCVLLWIFHYQYKATRPSPTPTHPLLILLCYILKLKNISIHFSVSRYNLTHEMTSLNVILPRRQTLELYTMDFLSSFKLVFQSQLGSYYPRKRAKCARLFVMLWGNIQHSPQSELAFQPEQTDIMYNKNLFLTLAAQLSYPSQLYLAPHCHLSSLLQVYHFCLDFQWCVIKLCEKFKEFPSEIPISEFKVVSQIPVYLNLFSLISLF